MKLILLPGIHGKEALLDDFIVYLAADIDTEVIALPGQGRQTYTRLTELVSDALPLDEDYVLLGESFSSVIAKRIADTQPRRLRGVILVSAFLSCPNPILKMAEQWMPFPAVRQFVCSQWLLRLFCAGTRMRPEVLAQISDALRTMPPSLLRARLDAMVALRGGGSRIHVPTCYIRPVQDHFVDDDCVREIKQTLVDALVCKVEAPHFALQAQPALCASIVNHFMTRLPERLIRPAWAARQTDEYRVRIMTGRR